LKRESSTPSKTMAFPKETFLAIVMIILMLILMLGKEVGEEGPGIKL